MVSVKSPSSFGKLRKKLKMDAIEALQPVNHVFHLFGLSVMPSIRAKFPYGCLLKCYCFLLNAGRIGIFASTLITQLFFVRSGSHKMYKTIDIILVCGIRLLEIINSTEGFFKGHQEKELMKNFLEIDKILMHRFNVDLRSHELRPSAIKRLIIWLCTIAFTLGGNLLLTHFCGKHDMFFFYLTYVPPLFTTSLTYFQIIIWADLIRYRLHVVNRLIGDLNHGHIEVDQTIRKLKGISRQLCISDLFGSANGHFDTPYDAHIFERIRIICDLHRRLWIQTNLVNERFKCSMVLNIGNEFVSLVSNLYFTFMFLKDQQSFSPTMAAVYFLNSIVHIFHISMLSRTCHHASNEAANIAYGIHNNKYVSKNMRLSSFVSLKKDSFPMRAHITDSNQLMFTPGSTFLIAIASSKSSIQRFWIF